MTEDRCICCNQIVPEGTQVCINCLKENHMDWYFEKLTKKKIKKKKELFTSK